MVGHSIGPENNLPILICELSKLFGNDVVSSVRLKELRFGEVFVDSAAIMYLLGTEMDYKKEELSSSFVFNNPNETERCGCGESFKTS